MISDLPHTEMYTPIPHHDKGRLNWGEENKEEERQARRKEEQLLEMLECFINYSKRYVTNLQVAYYV